MVVGYEGSMIIQESTILNEITFQFYLIYFIKRWIWRKMQLGASEFQCERTLVVPESSLRGHGIQVWIWIPRPFGGFWRRRVATVSDGNMISVDDGSSRGLKPKAFCLPHAHLRCGLKTLRMFIYGISLEKLDLVLIGSSLNLRTFAAKSFQRLSYISNAESAE